jgi:hypothetical protein
LHSISIPLCVATTKGINKEHSSLEEQ